MAFVAIAFAALCLWIWPPIGDGLENFSDWLDGLDAWGAGIFGVANRALLVVGLHQFLNVPIWFQFGSYTKPDGSVVHGGINMFLAGDPNAGQFTSGFFPIMMFALVYYVVFRFAITRFDLRTPGREPEEEHDDVTKA